MGSLLVRGAMGSSLVAERWIIINQPYEPVLNLMHWLQGQLAMVCLGNLNIRKRSVTGDIGSHLGNGFKL